ncbi:MAG: GTP-binding protein [Lachnospiraceae bacterium]|nr:GTP-binding protein [Lachnospiraceae bacterium]
MASIPLYLINGFLEAGKTTFLEDVLLNGDFADGQKTLLILCEEGEVEYNQSALTNLNMLSLTVEEEQQFSASFLNDCVKKYRPKRVFVEMNGMWDPSWMFEQRLPAGLEIAQVITIVDASTFQVYVNNMKGILSNLFANTEMVIFNRATEVMPLHSFRRAVRGVNPRAMVYFEDADGNPVDPGMEEPPYDLNADVIQLDDMDYGLWYLDVSDNPQRYEGKKVRFLAKIMKSRRFPENTFIPGRNVMTCCENDIRFVGYVCRADFADQLKSRQWVWITAEIHEEYAREYGEEGPVLRGIRFEEAEKPEDEVVYFN